MERQEHEFLETCLWLARAIARHLKMFCLIVGIATLGSIVITQFIDKEYESKAVVLPPMANAPSLSSLGGQFSSVSKMLGMAGGDTREADILEQLLNSRELHKAIIDSFRLVHLYEMDKDPRKAIKEADVLKRFRRNFKVESNDLEFFDITFRDKDPERAKMVVDYALAHVDSIYSTLKWTTASDEVEYIDRRIAQVTSSIDSLKKEMSAFQRKHGVVDPEVQYEETVKLLAAAMQEEAKIKLELDVEKQQHGDKSIRYAELKARYDAAHKNAESLKKRNDSILLSVDNASSVMIAFAQYKADLELQIELLTGLKLQKETAEIQAKKGAPKFTVLERPWLNDKKVSPPRMAIVLLTFFLAAVIATFIAVVIEFTNDERDANGRLYHLLRSIGEALRPRK